MGIILRDSVCDILVDWILEHEWASVKSEARPITLNTARWLLLSPST